MTTNEHGYPDERQDRKPYSMGYQILRLLWWVGDFFLFRCSMRPFYAWRRMILRMYGAKISHHVYIQRTARITFPWNLEMGKYSCIGENANVYNLAKIKIGEFATISQHVHLCAGTHDYTKPEMPLIKSPITIGRGAWIATDAFIGPGVNIGDNAVIGARSVVVSDMPSEMVCAGNPCKPIKPRLPNS